MLESLRNHFNCIDQLFQHSLLTPSGEGWNYKGIHAKRVFFCEGTAICDNPWFRHLPVNPIKGETLLLKSADLILPKGIFHHQRWILSLGDGRYRIGSTYDENDSSPLPTQQGADELLSTMQNNTNTSFKQLEHKAGLRPSTPDSRPILGAIPGAKNLYVFNGLGSKGASTGPLMCQRLLQYSLEKEPLDSEISTARFQI
jgi:glycine/D-amino acid oxidase-like deaminating enzyme